MTTSSTRVSWPRRPLGGFTLAEVITAMTLGTMLMAGVMSSFLFLVRSGAAVAGYSEMESHARRGIEKFAQDLRMATAVAWTNTGSVTLTVPDNYPDTGNQVTYAYDSGTSGSTAQAFYRVPGSATSSGPKTVLTRNVQVFNYAAFDRLDNALDTPGATPTAIKRIQLSMVLRQQRFTTAAQSNIVVSASFILRNKPAN